MFWLVQCLQQMLANLWFFFVFISSSLHPIECVSVHNLCSTEGSFIRASWAKHNRGINYLMQIRNKSINGFNFILHLFLSLLFICLPLFLSLPICVVSKISSTEFNFLMSLWRHPLGVGHMQQPTSALVRSTSLSVSFFLSVFLFIITF